MHPPSHIRTVGADDDAALGAVIRSCMAEFGAGAAAADAELELMSRAYEVPRSAYFVLEEGGTVVGGAGIAPLAGAPFEVCELRKMYVLPGARGQGSGVLLLRRCLRAARGFGYQLCYLETLEAMAAARHLYERAGFRPVAQRPGSESRGCDRWFALEL